MAQPADNGSFATDTNYTNGPTGIPGTPTKTAPSAGFRAEGFIPQAKLGAQNMNWWMNIVYQWLLWLQAVTDTTTPGAVDWVYETPPNKTVWVGPLMGYAQAGQWGTINGSGFVQSIADADLKYIPLDFLPTGAVIQTIRARVDPGQARATAGNRMGVQFLIIDPVTPGSTVVSSITRDDGTTNLQYINLAGENGVVVDKATLIYAVSLIAGNDGGGHVPDSFHGLEVVYTDPGPRNW